MSTHTSTLIPLSRHVLYRTPPVITPRSFQSSSLALHSARPSLPSSSSIIPPICRNIQTYSSARQPGPGAASLFRTPLHNRFTLDQDIGSAYVNLVKPESERPDTESSDNVSGLSSSIDYQISLTTLLGKINPQTEHVLQVRGRIRGSSSLSTRFPLVKVISKVELRTRMKQEETSEKVKKRKLASSKEIAISWNIDSGDLSRYCERLEKFLIEGRQVQVTVATKVGTKGTVPDDKRRSVLVTVRETATSIDGSREFRAPEAGQARGGNPTVIMYFQGPTSQVKSNPSTTPETPVTPDDNGNNNIKGVKLTPEIIEKIQRAEEKHRLREARKLRDTQSRVREMQARKERDTGFRGERFAKSAYPAPFTSASLSQQVQPPPLSLKNNFSGPW